MEEKKIGQKFYRVWKDSWCCLGEVYKITDKKGGYYTVVDRKGNFHTFSIQDPSLIADKKDAVSLFYRLENEIKVSNKNKKPRKHSVREGMGEAFGAGVKTPNNNFPIDMGIKRQSVKMDSKCVNIGDWVIVIIYGKVEKYKIIRVTGTYVPDSTYREHGTTKIGYKFKPDINEKIGKGEIYEVSPLAKALIGKRVGESFKYNVAGSMVYGTILEIEKER